MRRRSAIVAVTLALTAANVAQVSVASAQGHAARLAGYSRHASDGLTFITPRAWRVVNAAPGVCFSSVSTLYLNPGTTALPCAFFGNGFTTAVDMVVNRVAANASTAYCSPSKYYEQAPGVARRFTFKGHRGLECVTARTGLLTSLFIPVPTYESPSATASSWSTNEVTVQFVYFSRFTTLSAHERSGHIAVLQHIVHSLSTRRTSASLRSNGSTFTAE